MSGRAAFALLAAGIAGLALAGCRERDVHPVRPPAVEIAPEAPGAPVDAAAARSPDAGGMAAVPGRDAGAPDRGAEAGGAEGALVLYLALDEAAAGRVLDRSGQGNDGQLMGTGTSLTEGRKGRALALAGGAHLQVGSSVSLNGVFRAFTAAAFVQISGTPAERSAVLARQGAYALGLARGRPYLSITREGAAAPIEVAATGAIPAGRWAHVAGVFDPAGVARIYVDGKEVAALPVAGTIGNSLVPLTIGAQLQGATVAEPLTGALDEIRLYTRALGASEIALLAAGS